MPNQVGSILANEAPSRRAESPCGKPQCWKQFTVWLAEQETNMWLILLEALGAGLILVLIVWWTMSGRSENKPDDKDPD
jgi:hypothetical protein